MPTRSRGPLIALLVVVVPAAIVVALGYISLRQWQTSADLLFREQARDLASMAADKVEMALRDTEDDVLGRLASVLETSGVAPEALDAFVAGAPLVRRLTVLDRRAEPVYSRAVDGRAAPGVDPRLAEALPGLWTRGRRELMTGDGLVLAAPLGSRGGEPVLAAVAWNIEALCDRILGGTVRTLEAPTIIAVVDEQGRPLYSREPLDGAERILVVPFRERLPAWRLAVYQPRGASPRQAVRRQAMLISGAFAVLLAAIAVGGVASYRLMRRESEMAQLKSDFVANVSHDLKTPLSVIRMFGETLEMGRVTDDGQRQHYYRVIARESERLSRLVENVLNFARIEGGRRTYEMAPTAVEPLIRDTLDAFAYPLAQQEFKVSVDVAPDVPPVRMDAGAVGQALANLVDNAIKYSADDRRLGVEARVVGGEVALAVVDAGIGIPREEHARIFEKFYRVGRSETQGRRGSGVGLALVRHVAEAHGGRVTVESTPGQGSRFTMWLPAT